MADQNALLDRHCSLAGAASWTDLLSNVTSLQPVRLDEHLQELLSPGGASPEIALDFLHEAAHQWCFASPVGATLAFMQTRVIHLATSAHFGRSVPVGAVLEDILRIETARELLRPLAEGIAMFAEFDALSGYHSTTMSPPLLMLAPMFGKTEPESAAREPAHELTRMTREILREARLTDDALRRRVALLSEPLAPTAGGYLPGYLAVKTLWAGGGLLAGSALSFSETDLFLSYLRAYVYRDYGLVNVLLDQETSGIESVNALSGYLQERLGNFFEAVDPETDFAAHEALAERLRGVNSGLGKPPPAHLHVDDLAYQAGVVAWSDVKAYMSGRGISEDEDMHREMQRTLNNSRHFMHFGAIDGELEVDVRGRARLWSGKRLVWDTRVDPAHAGRGRGRVELFTSTYKSESRMVALSREGDVLVVDTLGDLDVEDVPLSEVIATFSEIVNLRQFIAEARPFVDELLESSGGLELVEQLRRSLLPKLATQLYWPLALANCTWDLTEERRAAFADNGLLALPEASRDHVEGVALLGLTFAAGLTPPEAERVFGERGVSLLQTLDWLESLNREVGLPLLIQVGEDRITSF